AVERPDQPVLFHRGKSKQVGARWRWVADAGRATLPFRVEAPFVKRALHVIAHDAALRKIGTEMRAVRAHHFSDAVRATKHDHASVEERITLDGADRHVGGQTNRKPGLR